MCSSMFGSFLYNIITTPAVILFEAVDGDYGSKSCDVIERVMFFPL